MTNQEFEQRVSGLRGRRHWSEDDARWILEALAASGETVTGFARRTQLARERLRWWRTRLGQSARAILPPQPSFVPMVVRSEPTRCASPDVAAVVVSGEVRVELRELNLASAAWTAAVMKSMRGIAP